MPSSKISTMNPFELSRINSTSPYKVELRGEEYVFETDYDIRYAVWFEEQPLPDIDVMAYWLNLTNRSQKNSPGDVKIRQTVICILEEFFRSNPDVLLYLCDSANDQQAMRSRLFLRWFNAYGQQAEYYTCTEMVKDGDEENYIALIVKRSHPLLQEIIKMYDEEIAMFRANKP